MVDSAIHRPDSDFSQLRNHKNGNGISDIELARDKKKVTLIRKY